MSLHDEIATLFAELSRGETDGEDPLEYYGIHTVERWQEYEAERSEWLERDPGARARRVEQWRKANGNRKRKRRGLHLSNAERLRLADDIRSGRMGIDEVADETGVSLSTAGAIGQLDLLEGVA